jgi:hypothetical protein
MTWQVRPLSSLAPAAAWAMGLPWPSPGPVSSARGSGDSMLYSPPVIPPAALRSAALEERDQCAPSGRSGGLIEQPGPICGGLTEPIIHRRARSGLLQAVTASAPAT